MSQFDREKWDRRYRDGQHAGAEPSALLTALDPWLPSSGRGLDVAGGAGRHALWLAGRGLNTTLLDISTVALDLATTRAQDTGLAINTQAIDLESDPFPAGPWDVIVGFHFLQRNLFDHFKASLANDGLLIYAQPTMRNLERHSRPPADFLLEAHELVNLVKPLKIELYREGWLEEGRHEALVVARK